MHPVEFPGSYVIGKPKDMTDEECSSIYARSFVTENGFPVFRMAWQPSYEDKIAIAEGRPIYIDITGAHYEETVKAFYKVGLRPHSVFTLDENGEIN